ncbi:MAG: helix-turn-helix domain-containing protein [Spirochaetota bacterium]
MFRILVADDERLEREALQFVIRQVDDIVDEVLVAANGREAVELSQEAAADIAILDIKMPGINGIEAARKIKDLHPRTRIVFLTAFNYFDYAQEAIRLHAGDFIIKPASNERIEEVVRGLAERLLEERSFEDPGGTPAAVDTDERDLAEGKLIGDAVLGHIDESILRRYLHLESDAKPQTTALVMRVKAEGKLLRPDSKSHERVLRRRVVSILRRECLQAGVLLLAGTETSALYALLVTDAGVGAPVASSTPDTLVHRVIDSARRELGVAVTAGFDGPSPGFSGLGLRFANAKTATKGGSAPGGGTSSGRSADRSARRALLESEQKLVRAILSGDAEDMARLGTDLFDHVRTVAPGLEATRVELVEVMAYVVHATAMQIGRLSPTIPGLLRSISDPVAEPEERDLRLVIAGICEHLAHQASEARESTHQAVRKARQLIDEAYAEDLSLDRIAENVRLSPFHLSRIFKSATGSTVLDYLTARRIEAAQRLIREGTLSVKEIAAQVGYADQNYFSRVFRRITGLTPSAFRKNQH